MRPPHLSMLSLSALMRCNASFTESLPQFLSLGSMKRKIQTSKQSRMFYCRGDCSCIFDNDKRDADDLVRYCGRRRVKNQCKKRITVTRTQRQHNTARTHTNANTKHTHTHNRCFHSFFYFYLRFLSPLTAGLQKVFLSSYPWVR